MAFLNLKRRFFPVYEGVYRSTDDWAALQKACSLADRDKRARYRAVRITGGFPQYTARYHNRSNGRGFDLSCARADFDSSLITGDVNIQFTYTKDWQSRLMCLFLYTFITPFALVIMFTILIGIIMNIHIRAKDFFFFAAFDSISALFVGNIIYERHRATFPNDLENALIADCNLEAIELAKRVIG